jgi:anti-sigma factor RsiW
VSDAGHTRWSEDLPAYVLGALEPTEAAAFERHLDGCRRCRAEVRWFEPAVATLPESVERREPPRSLRRSLMAEVRADAKGETPPPPARSRWFSRDILLRPAIGLAVLTLTVAAVAGYELGKGGGEGGASTEVMREHGVTVKMVREGNGGTLELANVRRMPPTKVLEAWVRRNGTMEPVPALFVPDRAGRASTMIADMAGVDAVMVTQEPQGGSEEPTSVPIVTMSIPR